LAHIAPETAAGQTDPQESTVSALSNRRFLKMNGLGNEIVIVDLRGTKARVTPEEARAAAAAPRSRFDQLMAIHDPVTPGTDAYLRIYNTDGSQSEACGNGTRCVAWAMASDPAMARSAGDSLLLETKAGLLPVSRVAETTFTVDMGTPRLRWDEIPLRDPFQDTRYIELQIGPIDAPVLHSPSVVNMGNPHAVFFVDDVTAHDLARFGPMLENHPIFPERANISLAQVVSPEHIVLRVWERGAGLTQACGSAACAALVAAARKKLTGRRATVTLPGGDLLIEWRDDDHVLMTGPVALEWEGVFELSQWERTASGPGWTRERAPDTSAPPSQMLESKNGL
jgi:diaminopimelate epimerase